MKNNNVNYKTSINHDFDYRYTTDTKENRINIENYSLTVFHQNIVDYHIYTRPLVNSTKSFFYCSPISNGPSDAQTDSMGLLSLVVCQTFKPVMYRIGEISRLSDGFSTIQASIFSLTLSEHDDGP